MPSCCCFQKRQKRNAVTSDVTSDASPPAKKIKEEEIKTSTTLGCRREPAEASFAPTGSYFDDTIGPEVTWDTMTSSSPVYSAVGPSARSECRSFSGFVTYPSPEPVLVTETTPGYPEPYSIHCGWAPPCSRGDSPHDQWLDASHWTTNEDIWSCPTFKCDPIYFNTPTPRENPYFDCSFAGHSQRCSVYESLSGADVVSWAFDDYIDDVLSVMANAANNCSPISCNWDRCMLT